MKLWNRGVFCVVVTGNHWSYKKNRNTIFYRKQKLLHENTSLRKNREFLSHLWLVMSMTRELCKVGEWVVGKVFLIKSYACQKQVYQVYQKTTLVDLVDLFFIVWNIFIQTLSPLHTSLPNEKFLTTRKNRSCYRKTRCYVEIVNSCNTCYRWFFEFIFSGGFLYKGTEKHWIPVTLVTGDFSNLYCSGVFCTRVLRNIEFL